MIRFVVGGPCLVQMFFATGGTMIFGCKKTVAGGLVHAFYVSHGHD
ncbi:MAG: hypothetical protein ACI9TH_002132 [Kiritimatiellia bacterium]|jgi:hypothetical protein